eukprot:PLAT7430.1.p1 GENE.PLAT7430.1~~PLAT7430.1.p1  ORF type:complete len:276 (-),score=49.68 PLAT7430.1:69-896(-)
MAQLLLPDNQFKPLAVLWGLLFGGAVAGVIYAGFTQMFGLFIAVAVVGNHLTSLVRELQVTVEGDTLVVVKVAFGKRDRVVYPLADVQGFQLLASKAGQAMPSTPVLVFRRQLVRYNMPTKTAAFLATVEAFIADIHGQMEQKGFAPSVARMTTGRVATFLPGHEAAAGGASSAGASSAGASTRACPSCGKTIGVPAGVSRYACPLCDFVIDESAAVAVVVVPTGRAVEMSSPKPSVAMDMDLPPSYDESNNNNNDDDGSGSRRDDPPPSIPFAL